MSLTHRTIVLRLLIGAALSSLALSCKQYEYASPLPGVLEVRLRVVNNRQDLVPFGPQNQFGLLLKELNALEPGNIRQPIYADLYALRRSPDGDAINALDTLSRDSAIILGATYAPPTSFAGLNLTMNFSQFLFFFRPPNPLPILIAVNPPPLPAPPPPTFFEIQAPSSIKVNEDRLTVVTVTFNLDSVLVRRSEDFEFHPSFYISSIQNY